MSRSLFERALSEAKFRYDAKKHKAWFDGKDLDLQPKATHVGFVLMRDRGGVPREVRRSAVAAPLGNDAFKKVKASWRQAGITYTDDEIWVWGGGTADYLAKQGALVLESAGLTKRQQKAADKQLSREAYDVAERFSAWLTQHGKMQAGKASSAIMNLRSGALRLQIGKGGRGDRNEVQRAMSELEREMS